MEFFRPVWAEIDLGALKRNFRRVKSFTKSDVMPIVKADAYGHGAIAVVRALREEGVTRFGVAILDEALELRKEFPDIAIMVIGPTLPEYSEIMVRDDIIPEVFQLRQAEALSAAAEKLHKTARLHIKVDTGMGRIGFRDNAFEAIQKIAGLPGLFLEGIYTHLATADGTDLTYVSKQLTLFNTLRDQLRAAGITIPIRHAANSAAIIQVPESHFELCRPGIILYGLLPMTHTGQEAGFEPVLSLKTRISQLKTIRKGESVGYGRTFVAERPTQVATLPIGYADGWRRSLSNNGEVLIKGKRAAIIGRICMDQTMVDVTDIRGVDEGDEAILIGDCGEDRITADEIAGRCGTISYEITCGLTKRVPRVIVDNDI
ncbi:alanine racemase [Dehalobacter sp. DCM]|uniref:alanine racemase n=1 Tax=Dehalobacter sp. DCM TaxID=2907827 RepID=UPI003081DDD6|nr:alanine racemase [Dehalobacter sp. DCM]